MEALCGQLIPTHGRGFLTATCVDAAACSCLPWLTSRGPCRRVPIILCTRVSKSSLLQYGFHFWGTLKTPQLSGNSGSYSLESACLSPPCVPSEDWKFRSSLGRAGFWGGLSWWFANGSLLTVSSRGARKQGSVSLVSFLKRILILLDQAPSLWPHSAFTTS